MEIIKRETTDTEPRRSAERKGKIVRRSVEGALVVDGPERGHVTGAIRRTQSPGKFHCLSHVAVVEAEVGAAIPVTNPGDEAEVQIP
jgi:hypothetical protein